MDTSQPTINSLPVESKAGDGSKFKTLFDNDSGPSTLVNEQETLQRQQMNSTEPGQSTVTHPPDEVIVLPDYSSAF
ncbi:hypothetical protein Hypma_009976 [Hypsizygus marmoreus]|uniref:Uncharacterized protein n=1 Tax=Hypsizygus marmoreus TaxID=39966 RepID=A0A369JSR3_HYPMA|nr:hypothetical protein Hypma_009976 [Hypsizygus marmoreus]